MIQKLYRSLSFPLAVGALSMIVGCSSGGSGEEPETPTGKARSVEITAEEYKFTPSQFTASPGEQLTIALNNKGKMEHSIKFELDGKSASIDRDVAPGTTGHLTITAPSKTGTYIFYSPVDNDRKMGMEGRLEVQSSGTTRR